ncbi:MAG: hypothetical protein QOC87_1373 [Actinomycetota bacterium]|nr:hypothetical protein [Actinomycetota bacterium]
MNAPKDPTEAAQNATTDGAVVDLGTELPPPPPLSGPQSSLHGMSISAMAICALVGIVAMIALITVRWPGNSERVMIALIVFASIGFLVSASTAVFSAARDSYPRRSGRQHDS